MNDKILNAYANYMDGIKDEDLKRILYKKYYAVCIDIDGTLIEKEYNQNSEDVAESIYKLLVKRVPVILITGRGITGIREYIYKLDESIGKINKDSYKYTSKIIGLINDGAVMVFSDKEKDDTYFNDSRLLVEASKFQILSDCERIIKEQDFDVSDKVDITYSRNEENNIITNIRFILKDEKYKIDVYNLISSVIKGINVNYNNVELNVTNGEWKGKSVLQIGLYDKSKAIETIEEYLGLPKNTMLRIGDCGDKIGNDFLMLNCEQGFTVNKSSHEKLKCHPVIDENNLVIKGVLATKYLLDNLNIISSICLEKPSIEYYTKKFSKFEEISDKFRYELIDKYNKNFSNAGLESHFINRFVDETGSIFFKITTLDAINNNALKTLFTEKSKDGSYKYGLATEYGFILRGPRNYYNFLCDRESNVIDNNLKKDPINKTMLKKWFLEQNEFLAKSGMALKNSPLNNVNDIKLMLGLVDVVRNLVLVLLQSTIQIESHGKDVIIDFENIDKNTYQYQFYKQYIDIIDHAISTFEGKKPQKSINDVVSNIHVLFSNYMNDIMDKTELNDYSKMFRVFREADNFMENYITVKESINKILSDNISHINACGIAYGGIELPFLAKALFGDQINPFVLYLNDNYLRKHSTSTNDFSLERKECLSFEKYDKKCYNVLMDDNLLTAKTMQVAINVLFDNGVEINNVIVTRYPSGTRLNHMFLANHGALDVDKIGNYILGMYFQSPYSRNDLSSGYEDSFGVFNITRKIIKEYLYKNGDYLENSEVAHIKNYGRIK